jgi:hypothetical protein
VHRAAFEDVFATTGAEKIAAVRGVDERSNA